MSTHFSYVDWAAWPEPDNGRIELVGGKPYVRERCDLCEVLALLVAGVLVAGGEEPCCGSGIVVDETTVLHPDICLLEPADVPTCPGDPWLADTEGRRRAVRVAIDIDTDPTRLETLHAAGVPGVWLLDPEGDVLAYKGEPPPPSLLDALEAESPPPPYLN